MDCKNNFYVEAKDRKTGKTQSLHRLVMGNPQNAHVDHLNHNPRENRKQNLRIVNRNQNMANAKKRKDNTSGVKGFHIQIKLVNGRLTYKSIAKDIQKLFQ